MSTNESLKNQVATNQKNEVSNGNKPKTIGDYIDQMAPAMAQALPKHMSVERMTRMATTVIRTTPQLKEADVASLLGAVMQSAQLGLEPGPMGHCYFLPFKNNKKGTTEVTFIIGYKGMIDLARRSGHISTIYAHAVYENDEFEYELGLHADLKHKPSEDERGAFKGAYAVAHFKDGGYQFEYMPKSDIDKRRSRSKAGNSNYSPWATDYEEMAKKTVIRHMWKYLPVSVEMQQAVAHDEGTGKDIKDVTPDEDSFVDMPEYIADVPAEGEGE
ncbi:recombination protein RecT [Salinicoccus albus]|uniref:recombination protein RecT n=1 Tax=Salinicoccus albus TaxID=418756 RepID=UPI000374DE49|nr:recombination protein RecT [Salinicoccus albus]